ncbi:PLP-dependent aminotransferase family protein [Alkalihalophilus lindianensis]|uniref:PLP-dependent aminotransferase family protein n=1 Tax=Alkalihalophilus lindianensis TaxID=1630542 RepID=A0ABU3X9W7_9BACI|nr:PLP-dependent aminotransferase family protein [Alkalihalophilus lindianensis]MDV2684676.1 PLP-dependent aminotransferase family protein [Alkalihalophilus lindianensis]
MNMESFLSNNIKAALKNDPPGEWMPALPDKCIRLSSGYPEPSLVPTEQIKESVVSLLDMEKDLPLHYLGSSQIDKLKGHIHQRLTERAMGVQEDELLLTSGASQAIDLIARILIDENCVVALEAPTYMEALEIFQNYTEQFISIPVDELGLQTEKLEEMLKDRNENGLPLPRLLYTIPTFQNPTGTTMTKERRKHVIELADQYNFLIVEDDAYGELSFDQPSIPLKALDCEGRVLHVGSLSKVVAPGMRIGWVSAPAELITAMNWFKKDLDHPFSQATMATYLDKADLSERLNTLRTTYESKCGVLLSALEQYLPDSVSWYIPKGGYFVWVKVAGVDTSTLLTQALNEGISYVPGKYFYLQEQEGMSYLRLSFSYASKEEIVEGVRKLAKVIGGLE